MFHTSTDDTSTAEEFQEASKYLHESRHVISKGVETREEGTRKEYERMAHETEWLLLA